MAALSDQAPTLWAAPDWQQLGWGQARHKMQGALAVCWPLCSHVAASGPFTGAA